MHKGIIAWVVIFVVLIALWYFFADFANPFGRGTTTTVVGNTVGYTTVPGTVYTCIGEDAEVQGFNSVIRQSCTWGGGPIALWAASGMAGHTNAWVIGQDGHVYINETFTNPCIAFENVYNLPAQEYSVIVGSGLRNATQGRSACGYMGIEMGSLPDSANATFDRVVNGNFLTGTYYGWTATGPAFGVIPLNLTKANGEGCYPMAAQWRGYNGTYFASTYACGLASNKTGNLTSAAFTADSGFLNFQVLGSGGIFSYIEVLYDNQSYIKDYISTSNMSNTRTGSFTFTNATIPLLTVRGKSVRIKIVVNEQAPQDFLVVGDFRMGATPVPMKSGVLVNVTLS